MTIRGIRPIQWRTCRLLLIFGFVSTAHFMLNLSDGTRPVRAEEASSNWAVGNLEGICDVNTFSTATGINDAGQVVGYSGVSDGGTHAILWSQGSGMVDLGTLGGFYNYAAGINDAGQVVGQSNTASNDAFHAFLWSQGSGMVDLGTLGGDSSTATGINNAGQVVGKNYIGGDTHAFLWSLGSGMVDLGTLGGLTSSATGINDAGQVIGGSSLNYSGSLGYHAFLWSQGSGMVDLGTLGGDNYSEALAINNAGQVVGASYISGYPHAFLWSQGSGMMDLGTLAGDSGSTAYGINDAGQVVGYSFDDSSLRAFLWSLESGMVDLGTLGGLYSFATGINDAGQVVGYSGTDVYQAVRWTPLPLEVSQGIQNRKDDMDLIEGRRTLIRAFMDVGPGQLQAQLYGYDANNNELPDSPQQAQNKAAFRRPANADRAELNDSLWFVVPKSWRQGTVRFKVAVETTNDGVTCRGEANATKTFLQGNTLDVKWVKLKLYDHGNTSNPALTYRVTDPGWSTIDNSLWRLLPVGAIHWLPSGPTISVTPTVDLRNDADQTRLRAALEQVAIKAKLPIQAGHTKPFWIGMIHPDIDTTSITTTEEFLGEGKFNESAVIVKMKTLATSNTAWYNQGGGTLVHELGHNLNFKHVLCDGHEGGTLNPLYPNYPWVSPCRLAPVDTQGYYGLDVYSHLFGQTKPSVISNDPSAAVNGFPIMGYKEPYWSSPWEYCKLMNNWFGISCALTFASMTQMNSGEATDTLRSLPGTIESSSRGGRDWYSPSHLSTGDGIIVTALVSPTTGVGHIMDVSLSSLWEASPPSIGSSDAISVVQVNGMGQVLHSRPISLNDQRKADVDAFVEVVPAQVGLAALQLRQGLTVLDQISVTVNAPAVQVVTPNGGESLTAQSVITWTASDTDGDPLQFDVLYSRDAGTTWDLLAEHHTGTVLPIAALDGPLAGSSQGRIRVIASDGFRTTYDDSDGTFSVPNSPPIAVIAGPPSDLTVVLGDLVTFEGIAMDGEDDTIDESGISWQSDLDGVLGMGAELSTDQLSVGLHHVTLTATDSGGLSGTATVNVLVMRKGDCNSDGQVNAGDLSAATLELFDGDDISTRAAPGGSFPGTVACDANEDQIIDAADLPCTVLMIFNGADACGG